MSTTNRLAPSALVALVALTGGLGEKALPADMPTNQIPKSLSIQTTKTVEMKYLLFLPKGYEAQDSKRWPLILFLHGAGERGSDLWKVATHGPPKHVRTNPDFPFIVVSPQCAEGKRWETENLLALLDQVIKDLRVDTSRIYLTGLSMGGYGTWALGMTHPERFAAFIPICGGGQTIDVLLAGRDKANALKTMGIWVFHGAKDPVVPLAESQRMVDALKRAGISQVKFTVYPEAQHDSWSETYKNTEVYNWLLEHQRK